MPEGGRITAVWSADHHRHAPEVRAHMGLIERAQEVADRGEVLGAWLRQDPQVDLAAPDPVDLGHVLAVHDPGLVRFLATVADRWRAAGLPLVPARPALVPHCFPNPGLRPARALRESADLFAQLGSYCVDTLTVVFEGTWEAALAAVAASVTAARLAMDSVGVTYAAVRPPGHHAGPRTYGGACYLNNAAVAAHWLTGRGLERVGVIDIDAHHGNGTQEIFYSRPDVFFGSLHADPASEYPYWVGFADEHGEGAGAGTNLNVPLEPRTADEAWLAGLEQLLEALARFDPQVIVVSLGVDGLAGDPNSTLELSPDAYAAAGIMLGRLGRPLVCVQEGGYVLPMLARTVREFLFAAAAAR